MSKGKDLADMARDGQDLGHVLLRSERMTPPSEVIRLQDDQDQPDPAVQELLTVDKQGFPKKTYANLVTVLERDARWNGLRLNVLGPIAEFDGKPIREPELINRAAVWLQRVYGLDVGPSSIRDAVSGVLAGRVYNPVQEYLRSLRWDGEPRICHVATKILRAADTDLHRIMIRRFFIGAVARAIQPGCKLDTALILVGEQGAFKSTFFRVMFGDWFADSPIPIGSKDAFIQLGACWGYEAAEMESLSRSTAEAVKQFLSAPSDTYRGVFERFAAPRPRRSVMVGSTNREAFLVDETGSRRFWPVTVGAEVDIALARAWRDQLWAEALVAFESGEQWHLTREEETARQELAEGYAEGDPWDGPVRAWLARGGFPDVRIDQVLTDAVEMPQDRQDQRSARRVAGVLRRLGYQRIALPRTSAGARPVVWGRR